MKPDTPLFRQVHPSWMQAGGVTSQAFKPTRKDNNGLSVYDGDMFDAESSWHHYTKTLSNESAGVLAVTVHECYTCHLDVMPDPEEFLGHVMIDFTGKSRKQTDKTAARLRDLAIERGWKYKADDS